MKYSFLLLIAFAISITVSAQPCKHIKPGMNKDEVVKLIGHGETSDFLGIENNQDSIVVWNYKKQQVLFMGDKVERVVVDAEKETELALKLSKGEITREEFEKNLLKLQSEECK